MTDHSDHSTTGISLLIMIVLYRFLSVKPAPTCSRGSYISLTVTRRGSIGQCLIKCQMTCGEIYTFPLVLSGKKLEKPRSSLSCLVKWCGGITRPETPLMNRPEHCVLTQTFFTSQIHQLTRMLIGLVIAISPIASSCQHAGPLWTCYLALT